MSRAQTPGMRAVVVRKALRGLGWRAFVLMGSWGLSTIAPMGALWAGVPGVPVSFRATPGDGSVSLLWEPEPVATYYVLDRRILEAVATPTGTLSPVATLPASASPSFSDPAVTNGRSYVYELRGVNGSGSGAAAALTVAPFRPPSAIQPVTVQRLHSGALDLFWASPAGSFPVSFIRVFRFVPTVVSTATPTPSVATPTATPTGTWATSTPSPTPTWPPTPRPASEVLTAQPTPYATARGTSFVDVGATLPGVPPVYYVLQAVDASGNEGPFPGFSTLPARPAPLPPSVPILSATVPFGATPTFGIRLQWPSPGGPEDALSYIVKRQGVTIAVLTPTPGSMQVYDDVNAPTYPSAVSFPPYQVFAENLLGSSGSNTVKAGIVHPVVPGSLQATPDRTAQAVTLGWGAAVSGTYGLAGYRIYRSGTMPPPVETHTHTPVTDLAATPAATLSWTDPGVSNAHGLYYWVEPYDTLGRSGSRVPATPVALSLAPESPSAPAVTGPSGNNRFTISWDPAGPGFYGAATGYRVARSVGGTPTPQIVATLPASIQSWDDAVAGVTPGTELRYRVAALDALGNASAWSPESSAVTIGNLSLPESPQASLVSGAPGTLTFSWAPNPGSDEVLSYEVHAVASPVSTPLAVVTAAASPMNWAATGVNSWEEAVYWLYAVNSQGRGIPATLRGIGAGSHRVAAVLTPENRTIRVSWTLEPTPVSTPVVETVRLYRSTSPSGGFTPVAELPFGTTHVEDFPQSGGSTYHYRITARAASGAESPLLPGLTPDPVASVLAWPSAPAFTVTPRVAEARFAWQPTATPEQITAYRIYRDASTTPEVELPSAANLSVTLACTPAVRSVFRLAALNPGGEGDANAVTLLAPPAVTPTIALTPPAGWSPTPSATEGSRQVFISNLAYSGDVTSYDLYRASDPLFANPILRGSVTVPVSILSDPPEAGAVHYYRVVARSSTGVSAEPSLSGPMTAVIWPAAPSNLELSASDTSVTLAWSPPASGVATPVFYTIRRSLDPTLTPLPVATVAAPAGSWVDASVTPGSAVVYSVQAEGIGGPGPATSPVAGIVLAAPTLQVTPRPGRNILVWNALPTTGSAAGYLVWRRVLPTPQFTPWAGLVRGMGVTTFTDSSLDPGNTYVYRVSGADERSIPGALSGPVTVAATVRPVENLRVLTGDGIVQLFWSYPTGLNVTHSVQRRLGSAPLSDYATLQSGLSGSQFTDVSAARKTWWAYRVVTTDPSTGLTAVSAEVTALPARFPVLADRRVTAEPVEAGIVLSWNAANPPGTFDAASMYPLAGYRIYRSVDGGATFEWIATLPAGTHTYTDPVDVLGGPVRSYRVTACDDPDGDPGAAHETPYDLVSVAPLKARTALDRNVLRPLGTDAERRVNLRFVVTRPGSVSIRVYTLSGTPVKRLVAGNYPEGIHWTSWDGRNESGDTVASGVYLVTTVSDQHREVQKIAVVK